MALSMAITTARKSVRLRVSPPIGQSFLADLFENGGCALFIVKPLGLAIVVAEVELINITLQMLFAHALVNTSESTLEDREEAFCAIRCHYAASVFLDCMVYGGVLRKLFADIPIARS